MRRIVEKVLYGILGLALLLVPLSVGAEDGTAATDHVVIYQVQTGGSGSGTATEELVVLYNPTPDDVTITNWCIQYLSSSLGSGSSWCVDPPNALTNLVLESDGLMTFSTASFVAANEGFAPDFTIGGGFAASGGHMVLRDATDIEVDRVGWGTALEPELAPASVVAQGRTLSRDLEKEVVDTNDNSVDFVEADLDEVYVSGLYEEEILIDACNSIDGFQDVPPPGFLADELGGCYKDVCANIDGLQTAVPLGFNAVGGACVAEDAALLITELYPNAPGSDSGQEFIEIYNPNARSISLEGYVIQLGPTYTKEYALPPTTIALLSYVALSDTTSGITLPNTKGITLRLVSPAGDIVSTSSVYAQADDEESWSFIDNQWLYTNQITPGALNAVSVIPAIDEESGVTSVLAPCPVGKFRNPATNRCKSLTSATSQLTPCDDDEFRNPDTNRCNKLAGTLAPCPEGQERNPDTNRCRKVTVLGASESDLSEITDIASGTQGQVNWSIISLVMSGTLGYMVYEWRVELRKAFATRRYLKVQ